MVLTLQNSEHEPLHPPPPILSMIKVLSKILFHKQLRHLQEAYLYTAIYMYAISNFFGGFVLFVSLFFFLGERGLGGVGEGLSRCYDVSITVNLHK